MTSRRIFLKNGGLALVSLGFAPAVPRADRGGGRAAAQGADHHLPARRGGRPEHGGAVRRARVLRGPAEHRDRAPGSGPGAAVDLDGFFGLHPRLAPLEPLFDARPARDRARLRLAGRHAVALRRAGLHGERHPGREEHARRLAESLPARARAPGGDAVSRGRAGAAAAALAAGPRAGAGDRSDRSSSASAPARAARWSRRRSRAEYAAAADRVLNTTSREAFNAVRMLQDRRSQALHARQRRRVPVVALRRGAAADRPADQGGRRARNRVRRVRELGSPRQRGGRHRTARHAAGRLRAAASPRWPAISATACRMSSF